MAPISAEIDNDVPPTGVRDWDGHRRPGGVAAGVAVVSTRAVSRVVQVVEEPDVRLPVQFDPNDHAFLGVDLPVQVLHDFPCMIAGATPVAGFWRCTGESHDVTLSPYK